MSGEGIPVSHPITEVVVMKGLVMRGRRVGKLKKDCGVHVRLAEQKVLNVGSCVGFIRCRRAGGGSLRVWTEEVSDKRERDETE